MGDNMRELHAQMDAIGRRIITKEIGRNIEYALEVFRERRHIVPCILRESELIVDQIGFRLHDAKYFAYRAPDVDLERYVKDDAYYAEQQAAVQQVLDPEKAKEICQRANELFDKGSMNEAATEYFRAAMYGSAYAQQVWATAAKDKWARCYWYWKAACGGSVPAMRHLGNAYRDGDGVAQDPPQMLYYYCTAAMQPEPDAQATRALGQALQEGRGLHGLEEQGTHLLALAEHPDQAETAEEIRRIAAGVRTQLLEQYEVMPLP